MHASPSPPPDLGNPVLLDHVNLRVSDHRLATAFYVEGLGLTRDPYRMVGTDNMWVNVGRQQFHLPLGPPAPLAGEIGLALPDPQAAARSLEAVRRELAGTAFAVEREGETLRLADPWGRRLRVLAAEPQPGRLPLAIPWVEFWVRPGTAAAIGAFYREVLRAPVRPTGAGGGAAVAVTVGPRQELRFRERAEGAASAEGLHVALYLTRFRETYAALEAMGAIAEGIEGEQFRFREIRAPEGGAPLFTLEHEIRSLYHRDYARPLVNRLASPGEPPPPPA